MNGKKRTQETQAVCVQQGGSTWELYVQLVDDPEAYVQDCEEHTYEAAIAGEIPIHSETKDGEPLVLLSDAVELAGDCIEAVRQIIGY